MEQELQNISPIESARAFIAQDHRLFINGAHVESASGATERVFDPATGEQIALVPSAQPHDVNLAVESARRSFDSGEWAKVSPRDRSRLLLRLAAALDSIADEMAAIETFDNGRPLRLSRIEHVGNAVEIFEYYAGWATKLSGTTVDVSAPGEFHAYTAREPVGVASLITAWNVPLQMAAMKLACALAAGCTAILKPAEQTPLSALRLARLVEEVGFPPGVVNVLTGLGPVTGAALAGHTDVDKVSFTGSVATGKAIVSASLGNLKRVTLELGGKSPVFVFGDADLDQAIPAAASAVFHNSGQVCAAGTRLYVHRSVFDKVVAGVAAYAARLKVGSGFDETVDLGPLISGAQQDRVLGFIASGRQDRVNVLTGGSALERPGYFVEPTVLTGAEPHMSVVRDEIFGPVLCAMPFDDENIDELAQLANDTIYGLSARIFTRDVSNAHRLARRIRAGSIRINGGIPDVNVPFGGYKQSGWGREGGREGVESYTEQKTVIVKLS